MRTSRESGIAHMQGTDPGRTALILREVRPSLGRRRRELIEEEDSTSANCRTPCRRLRGVTSL